MPRTRDKRRLRVPLAALAAVALIPGAFATPAQAHAARVSLTSEVNPFVGTQREGNTFPGAALPFGMVQLSPDTGHNTGYDYTGGTIRGFSSVHLSGVGCGAGGDLPVLPTTGEITATDYASYAAPFSHSEESATPGYYRVALHRYGGITAELTATKRTGWHRYTFPATNHANVLLNSGQALHRVTSSTVTVVDDRTIQTSITGRGFCADTRPYTVYTLTRFDRPFSSSGTWRGDTVSPGSRSASGSGRNGAYARFDTTRDRDVVATTALSYVSAAGAAKNLAAEGRGTFESTRSAARQTWEKHLGRVKVTGGTTARRRVFYTAVYHAFLHPNIGTDTDGRYTGWDGRIHTASGFTYYQNWSLWDTYRTQQQLLWLLAPRESRDMARSLLRINAEGGWLPKWGLATVETNVMTGDPVTPFLVNAYRQGLLRGFEQEAYAALRKNADGVPPADSPYVGRNANPEYIKYGFVPYIPGLPHKKPGSSDFDYGASATLEYALADAALGTMARDLGHRADARRYLDRGRNYRNIFDPRIGFFRPRDAQGLFTGPADPTSGVGFHEGTGWQYLWLVPQNVPDLARLIGGRAATNKRLDAFFAYDKLVKDPAGTARSVWVASPYGYYNQSTYNPENEPDLIAPYTYLYTGQPWKTTDVVHAALGLFTDQPDGITGNDDLGTMSSWAIMAAMGIFPLTSGTDAWGLTTPVFDRVEIATDGPNGRRDAANSPVNRFRISAPGTSDANRYIRSVSVGGKQLTRTYITTADIRGGRNVSFTLSRSPSRWGTGAAAAPPTVDALGARAGTLQRRVAAGVRPAEASVLAGRASRVDMTVSAVLTRAGRASGTVTAAAPRPLSVKPARTSFTLRSADLPATREVPLRVIVPATTPPGSYPINIRVTDASGTAVTRRAQVNVVPATCSGAGQCPQNLDKFYDTDGTAQRKARNQGDFDGTGFSFPAEELPAAGSGALGGRAYTFPRAGGTDRNFVTARGQTLPLTRRAYRALDLLVAAHHGDVRSTVVVHYSDGSSERVPLAVSDWATAAPRHGEDAAVRAASRYGMEGEPDGVPVTLWHQSVKLDPNRQAVSITLPNEPRLLLYAMSGRNA